jgi:hypothetical protein
MPHIVTYNAEAHTIETKIWGKLVWDEAKNLISDIVQAAKENNCFLCLSDFRQAELDLSVTQLFDVPKAISDASAALGVHPFKFKRALVIANDLAEFEFFETVTFNQGQRLRIFNDIDEAKMAGGNITMHSAAHYV